MARGRILIVGAGLGGLAAASCLLRAGFDVEVFEQAPALGEIGAGIQISANAMHVLRHLGLERAITELGVRPGAYVFRLHDTGEIVQQYPLAAEHERKHGAPYVQLHRADFHEVLAAAARALKPGLIHLGMKAASFREDADGVELRFADGSTARGDVLVGADGLKSTIARQIVGEVPATYTGDAAWRLTVPVERLPKPFLDQVMTLFLGPGGHAVCYYIRAGRLLNFVGCVETEDVAEESWTLSLPWERLRDDYVGWHPEVQAIVNTADRGKCYRWSLHNRPPLRNWSTARATLLGDSAHATLPYLAQGAAMAIEDGAVLARALLGAATVPEALDLYQGNRVDRTTRIVSVSTENRRLYHLGSAAAIRAEFSRRDMGADRSAWLYSYNPMTVELK